MLKSGENGSKVLKRNFIESEDEVELLFRFRRENVCFCENKGLCFRL